MTPRILLFRGNGWISRLIRWQTNGDYSHAAVQLSDGRIIEAWHKPSGVRIRPEVEDWSKVESYEVEGMTDEQWEKAESFLLDQLGKKYDFNAIGRFLTRWRKDQDEKWFCSELAFAAVKEAGIELLSRCDLAQVSPTVLSFSPLLKPVKNKK